MTRMRLENIVWDACDPRGLGEFWTASLDAEPMTDDADGYEARLRLGEELFLDLCFQPVTDSTRSLQRLHLDLAAGDQQEEVVDRLLALGARHVDIGQGDVPWVVLADPEGNAFCVMEHRDVYTGGGPIAALPLDCADPVRDARFWAAVSGWVPAPGVAPASLRHPSGVGPLLELCPEPEPKNGKNPIHLDIRPRGPDVVQQVEALGGRALEVAGAEGLSWTVMADPSGNEFCVLAPEQG